jgi:hypothetical protein
MFKNILARIKSAIGGGGSQYDVLLAKAGGDVALVERLVTYEQKRNPTSTRSEWVADALDRWERDRT